MSGWIADSFRFLWALFYWNVRKTWFRLRGAHRDDCPCQIYGDSGQAFDSRCEAVSAWHRPERFRRVCPLLVNTPEGWRCSVNAESVHPFWGRAWLYGGSLLFALYLLATIGLFTVLRSARYDVTYSMLAWPPHWPRLRIAQEKLYATRAQAALQSGNFGEAMLSLEMVNQINPQNYPAGLALAGLKQLAGQPHVADHIYERLMRNAPDQRRQTAQLWYRALLTRGAYAEAKQIATLMLNEDPAERAAWLHALLFSCRQTGDAGYLGIVLAEQPHLADWCTELISIEQLLLQNQFERALPKLTRLHRQPASIYIPFYQVDRLIRHGAAARAGELLRSYETQVPADEMAVLRLRTYQAQGFQSLLNPEFELLLSRPLSPRIVAQVCAWLVSQPESRPCQLFLDKFSAANLPLNAQTVPLYNAAFLVAAVSGDKVAAEVLAERIAQFTSSNVRALRGLGELLKSAGPDERLFRVLPLVPLPTETVYASIERKSLATVTK